MLYFWQSGHPHPILSFAWQWRLQSIFVRIRFFFCFNSFLFTSLCPPPPPEVLLHFSVSSSPPLSAVLPLPPTLHIQSVISQGMSLIICSFPYTRSSRQGESGVTTFLLPSWSWVKHQTQNCSYYTLSSSCIYCFFFLSVWLSISHWRVTVLYVSLFYLTLNLFQPNS